MCQSPTIIHAPYLIGKGAYQLLTDKTSVLWTNDANLLSFAMPIKKVTDLCEHVSDMTNIHNEYFAMFAETITVYHTPTIVLWEQMYGLFR